MIIPTLQRRELKLIWGLPKWRYTCHCRRHKRRGFHPWVRKIPWRRTWQCTPGFLPGESHGQRSLADCSQSLQSLSCVRLFVTPWTAACQACLSITNSRSLLKLMSIESAMPSNHLILCHLLCPILLLSSIFPNIRVFSNESVFRIRWPKYWSFSVSISCSNEYSGLISFRMDWLDLLTVQGTLKSLLQRHSSRVSILQHSAFYMVQLSHPYMSTGKNIALTRWTFVGK